MTGNWSCSSGSSLATMAGLWPLCFGTVGAWFVGDLLWEVGAAGGFASTLGNDDLW
jgi:hypothetical protein